MNELRDDSVHLYDDYKRCFKPELQKYVYTLLENNVGEEHVSNVIDACLKMVNKKADRLPCRSSVNNMNAQRSYLALSLQQLNEQCTEKENTTLHTDETSKYGDKYGAFALRTSDGNYYVLGRYPTFWCYVEIYLCKSYNIMMNIMYHHSIYYAIEVTK